MNVVRMLIECTEDLGMRDEKQAAAGGWEGYKQLYWWLREFRSGINQVSELLVIEETYLFENRTFEREFT